MSTNSVHKKSIAIVANTTWNIYNFRLNVLDKLLFENFRIYVIAPVDEYIHYKESYPNVVHIPLKTLDRDSINPVKDILLTLELIRKYKRIRPDIVLHYTVKPNIYGAVAAKLLGIPSVAVVTGLGYAFIHQGLIKNITVGLYRLFSRFHKKVIFENIDDRLLFSKLKIIKNGQGISVKGCGVNTEQFYPDKNGKTGHKLIFSFIGRLLYDKGVKEFVEAAHMVRSRHDHVEFWIIGEIDKGNPAAIKEEDLISWVKDKSILYLGSTQNVQKYIAASDCIVLPSYREGMPRIILESMAMAKPVITTKSAGCRETVHEGENGYLIEVADSKSLEYAVNKFIDLNPGQREAMGIKGREMAEEHFNSKKIANEVFSIIYDALNQ